tara:strand:- start:497 stop:835 length:339 start_codon:yes stop_codon:yes gene_type:complete
MKKFALTVLIINGLLWFGLSSLTSQAKADDYNTAVVAHVIKEKISGNGVDMSVLENEMQKLAYTFALQMTDVLEKNLPAILEGIAAELRMNADSKYKCSLLKDTKIADKECS